MASNDYPDLSPEQQRDALQERLHQELGPYAPRLGAPPERVSQQALWAWLGACGFAFLAGFFLGEDTQRMLMWLAGVPGGGIAWLVARGYSKSYDNSVQKARAAYAAYREEQTARTALAESL